MKEGEKKSTLHIRIQLTSFFLLHMTFDLFEYIAIRIVLNLEAEAAVRVRALVQVEQKAKQRRVMHIKVVRNSDNVKVILMLLLQVETLLLCSDLG
jgi:hypothetical protein